MLTHTCSLPRSSEILETILADVFFTFPRLEILQTNQYAQAFYFYNVLLSLSLACRSQSALLRENVILSYLVMNVRQIKHLNLLKLQKHTHCLCISHLVELIILPRSGRKIFERFSVLFFTPNLFMLHMNISN